MFKKLALILFCNLLVASVLHAQDGVNEALKEEAEELFFAENYQEAFTKYSQLLANFQKDGTFSYRFGACMLFLEADKEKPMEYLNYAVSRPNIEPLAYFFLGKAHHLNYRFDEAIRAYKRFQEEGDADLKKKYEVDLHIQQCKNGMSLLRDITQLSVVDRKDLQRADFFRNYELEGFGGKLLVKPEEFAIDNEVQSPYPDVVFLDKRTDVLFFAAESEKSKTGKDIYKIEREVDDFGKPQLVGLPINTDQDEDFPFYDSETGILYFCSKGHNSMGGYDVFRSYYDNQKGIFSPPENLDYAINTPDDDFLYINDIGDKNAYFASTRESPYGEVTLYQIKVARSPFSTAFIAGTFNSEQTKMATIKVQNMESGSIIAEVNSSGETGNYLLNLPSGNRYTFIVEVEHSPVAYTGVVDIPEQTNIKRLRQEISLVMVDGEEQLTIKNLFDEAEDIFPADLFKEFAKLQKNYVDQPEDLEQPEDSVVAEEPADISLDEDITNSEIIKVARQDAADLQKESEELKQNSEVAYAVATAKHQEAGSTMSEATELIAQAEANSDKTTQLEQLKKAQRLNERSKALGKEAEIALTLAGNLERLSERKAQEAVQAEQYANEIEAALNDNSPDALEKLEQLKELLAGSEGVDANFAYDELRQGLNEKQGEYDAQASKVSGIQVQIDGLKADIADMDPRIEAAKKKDKPALEQQKADYQAELPDLESNLTSEQAALVVLEEELAQLKAQDDYLNGVLASIENTDVSTLEAFDPSTAEVLKTEISTFETATSGVDESLDGYGLEDVSIAGDETLEVGTGENAVVPEGEVTTQPTPGDEVSVDTTEEVTESTGQPETTENAATQPAITGLSGGQGTTDIDGDGLPDAYAQEFSQQLVDAYSSTGTVEEQQQVYRDVQNEWAASIEKEVEVLGTTRDSLEDWLNAQSAESKQLSNQIDALNEQLDETQDFEAREGIEKEIAQLRAELKTVNDAVATNPETAEQYAELQNLNNQISQLSAEAEKRRILAEEPPATAEAMREQAGIPDDITAGTVVTTDPDAASTNASATTASATFEERLDDIYTNIENDVERSAAEMQVREEYNDYLSERLNAITAEGLDTDPETGLTGDELSRKIADNQVRVNAIENTIPADAIANTEEQVEVNPAAEDQQVSAGTDVLANAETVLEDESADGRAILEQATTVQSAIDQLKAKQSQALADQFEGDELAALNDAEYADRESTIGKLDVTYNQMVEKMSIWQSEHPEDEEFAALMNSLANAEGGATVDTQDQPESPDVVEQSEPQAEVSPEVVVEKQQAPDQLTAKDYNEVISEIIKLEDTKTQLAATIEAERAYQRALVEEENDLRYSMDLESDPAERSSLEAQLEAKLDEKGRLDSKLEEHEGQWEEYFPGEDISAIMDDFREQQYQADLLAAQAAADSLAALAATPVTEEPETTEPAVEDTQVAENVEAPSEVIDDAENPVEEVVEVENPEDLTTEESGAFSDTTVVEEPEVALTPEQAAEKAYEEASEAIIEEVLAQERDQASIEQYEQKASDLEQESLTLTQESEALRDSAQNVKGFVGRKKKKEALKEQAEIKAEEAQKKDDERALAEFTAHAAEEVQLFMSVGALNSKLPSEAAFAHADSIRRLSYDKFDEATGMAEKAGMIKAKAIKNEMLERADALKKEALRLEALADKHFEIAKGVRQDEIQQIAQVLGKGAEQGIDFPLITDKDSTAATIPLEDVGRKKGFKDYKKGYEGYIKKYKEAAVMYQAAKRNQTIADSLQTILDGMPETADSATVAQLKLQISFHIAQADTANMKANDLTFQADESVELAMKGLYKMTPRYRKAAIFYMSQDSTIDRGEDIPMLAIADPDAVEIPAAQIEGAGITAIASDESAYSEDRPIPINQQLPNGIIYQVQIGAFRNPIPQDLFKGFAPVMGEARGDGITRYRAGLFPTIGPATEARDQIRDLGYPDAFVVVFNNGERISNGQARRILAEQGVTPAPRQADGTLPLGYDPADPSADLNYNDPSFGAPQGANTGANAGSAGGSANVSATDVSQVAEVFFTVQVAVYRRLATERELAGIQPLNMQRLDDGQIRYSTGRFKDLNAARAKRSEVQDLGKSDAFITAYYEGERITVARALELIRSGAPASAPVNTPQPQPQPEPAPEPVDVGQTEPVNEPEPVDDPAPVQPANNAPVTTDTGIEENVPEPTINVETPAIEPTGTYDEAAGPVEYKVELGRYPEGGQVPMKVAMVIMKKRDQVVAFTDTDGSTIYRSKSFETKEQAEAFKAEMISEGIAEAQIVGIQDGKRVELE